MLFSQISLNALDTILYQKLLLSLCYTGNIIQTEKNSTLVGFEPTLQDANGF